MRVRIDAEPGEVASKLPALLKAILAENGADAEFISDVVGAVEPLCVARARGSALTKGRHFPDEDIAQRAHRAVLEQYPDVTEGSERYWKLKTHIYRKMGGSFGKVAKGLFTWGSEA